ncbi:MAG TPA: hypothetical protein VHD90_25735 [Phototrophicaceae bacterium]|nr:hypothetical protein [Phototrophicaceae bacterium]
MITQEVLADQILAYLNGRTSLAELVAWAEDALVAFTESDQRPANADAIWDTLLYLGAADSPGFPLTWEAIKAMLGHLGRPVQSVMA